MFREGIMNREIDDNDVIIDLDEQIMSRYCGGNEMNNNGNRYCGGNEMNNNGDNSDQGSDEVEVSDDGIEIIGEQGNEICSDQSDEANVSDHDDENIVDEEHIIDKLEVNMKGFRFSVDEDFILDTLHLEVNCVTPISFFTLIDGPQFPEASSQFLPYVLCGIHQQ
uniref:Uncharacterized protein n=1 Tax=Tanacetum cinerariifolium TaxID=118510 RepID=A0A6L2K5B8_TANCI|nr:hypothetical protein [Tanacetum cinerariifolium]